MILSHLINIYRKFVGSFRNQQIQHSTFLFTLTNRKIFKLSSLLIMKVFWKENIQIKCNMLGRYLNSSRKFEFHIIKKWTSIPVGLHIQSSICRALAHITSLEDNVLILLNKKSVEKTIYEQSYSCICLKKNHGTTSDN